MKQFKYLLIANILVFSLAGCSSDDSDNQVQEDMAWLNFTINGEIMNGDYSIEFTEESTNTLALAILTPHETLPNEYNASINFQDANQNLSTVMAFYANEANTELVFFGILSGIPGYDIFGPENPMTINITQLETINEASLPSPLITKIAATFSGTIVTQDLDNGDNFYHTIQGEFYFQMQYDDND